MEFNINLDLSAVLNITAPEHDNDVISISSPNYTFDNDSQISLIIQKSPGALQIVRKLEVGNGLNINNGKLEIGFEGGKLKDGRYYYEAYDLVLNKRIFRGWLYIIPGVYHFGSTIEENAFRGGKSAFQHWLDLGNTGTLEQFISSLKGEKGDAFVFENFTQEQLNLLKLRFSDLTPQEIEILRLKFEQLTQAEKDSLKLKFSDLTQAEKDSIKGEKGDAFVFEDFTQEQLINLKLHFSDLTPQEINSLKLKFSDLTQVEKDSLKLKFNQLTQAEKDSLKLKFSDLTQAEKDSLIGATPDHEIDGTQIRFKQPNGSWGTWIQTQLLPDILTPDQFAALNGAFTPGVPQYVTES